MGFVIARLSVEGDIMRIMAFEQTVKALVVYG